MAESRNLQKKHLFFVAGGIVVAAAVIGFSFLWPPASVEQTQGTIGKRDVYHDQAAPGTQPAEQVGHAVTAQAPATDADIAKQTEEFNKLMAIGQFKSALSNPRLKSLAADADFVKLMNDADFVQLISNSNFAQALASGAVSNALAISANANQTATEAKKKNAADLVVET